jgi:hypothetical protein
MRGCGIRQRRVRGGLPGGGETYLRACEASPGARRGLQLLTGNSYVLGALALMAILLVLAARELRPREPAVPPVRPAAVVAPSPR